MNWSKRDNPKPNSIDDNFVSRTEDYEVRHFVDAYLTERGFDLTAEYRRIVREDVMDLTLRAPIKRRILGPMLDKLYAERAKQNSRKA